jgi:hypothetical protein
VEDDTGIECLDIKRNVTVETGSPASDGSFQLNIHFSSSQRLPAKFSSTLCLFVLVFYNKSCNLGRWEKKYIFGLKFGVFVVVTPKDNAFCQTDMTSFATGTAYESGLSPFRI